MKWGVRKAPGSSGQKLFVSGSSKTQNRESPYFRRRLPKYVRTELKRAIKNGDSIIVGDAPGIDRQVQDYLKKKRYSVVDVYGPGKKVRYSADPSWKTHPINSKYKEGSEKWLAVKDRAMTKDSTKGLAVILDEGSSATKNNILRMQKAQKPMKIWELRKNTGLIRGFEGPDDEEVFTSYYSNPKKGGFEPVYSTRMSKSSMIEFEKAHPIIMTYNSRRKKWTTKDLKRKS